MSSATPHKSSSALSKCGISGWSGSFVSFRSSLSNNRYRGIPGKITWEIFGGKLRNFGGKLGKFRRKLEKKKEVFGVLLVIRGIVEFLEKIKFGREKLGNFEKKEVFGVLLVTRGTAGFLKKIKFGRKLGKLRRKLEKIWKKL